MAEVLPNPLGLAASLSETGLISITWAGIGLSGLLLVGRLTIRITKIKSLQIDDYFMIAAWTVLVVNGILQTIQTPYGYKLSKLSAGLLPFDAEALANGNKYVALEFTIIGLFWTVLWLVKASFLGLYWKLFDNLPMYRKLWWGVVLFAFGSYVGCWIISACVCHPPSAYFKFGMCSKPIDVRTATMSVVYSTTVDIMTDLMIMALPLKLLWKVRISKSEKQGLAFVFCIGFIIIVVAIVRAVQIAFTSTSDIILLALWGVIESTVAVMVGCLPPFKSLFQRSSTTHATSYDYQKNTKGFNSDLRNGSIPLQSRVTHNTKVRSSRDPHFDVKSESMEDILANGSGNTIVVQREVEIRSTGGNKLQEA